MALKIRRVCDKCLLEEKEEYYINRDDIKDARKCKDVGYIVNWLCSKCKEKEKNMFK